MEIGLGGETTVKGVEGGWLRRGVTGSRKD